MFLIISGIFIFILIVAVVIYIFIRDRRFENKSVVETMAPRLWDEIAKEREQAILKAKKFKEALEKAKNN